MSSFIPSEGSLKLRKPVEALVMVPRSKKLTPLCRKMYNVMLYVAQAQIRAMQGIPAATHLFEAPLREVLQVCAADGQHLSATKLLAEMRRCEVEWSSLDPKYEFSEIAFSLLSESRISRRKNATWIHWALPPALYEALSDPERWASIDLRMLARLETYAAIVLYEICTKYRDNPSNLTCTKPVEWWTEVLSASPVSFDDKGVPKLQEWRKFKHSMVNSAIEQINQNTDLRIDMLETKEGKAIKTVQFRVEVKRRSVEDADAEFGSLAPVNPDLLQYANRVGGLSEREIDSMARAHGDKAVASALQKLELRQSQLSLPLVKSKSGYMRFLLGEAQAEPAEVAEEVVEARTPFSAQVELQKAPAAQQAVQPKEPDLEQQRKDEVFAELMSLPKDEIAKWLAAYEKKMRAAKQFTPTIERRVRSDIWYVGMVKAGVIDLYGESKYGAGWKTKPAV